jgi:hypothetical protein
MASVFTLDGGARCSQVHKAFRRLTLIRAMSCLTQTALSLDATLFPTERDRQGLHGTRPEGEKHEESDMYSIPGGGTFDRRVGIRRPVFHRNQDWTSAGSALAARYAGATGPSICLDRGLLVSERKKLQVACRLLDTATV